MALSMEERRILAQIEVHLSQDDPRLAHRLEKFGRPAPPGRAARPRARRRARVIAAVMAAVLGVAAAIGTAIALLTALA
jgi:hypothetical protein